jgi:cytochrome c-type biogenesis protein CcmE
MNRYLKFGIPVVAILGTLVWLAFSSTKETAGYFKNISELKQMGDEARVKHLRVNGYVQEGSIVHSGNSTTFLLVENEGKKDVGDHLKVTYTGDDPLPDTFKDHAEALADGSLGADGVFHANKIQAKCASKYEAAPPPVSSSKPPTI